MNWEYIDSGSFGKKYAAPVKRIGAVSPAILPMLRIEPVTIPGMADGSTTCLMVCHLLIPSAREDSRYSLGTARSASSLERIITGRTRRERVRDAESIEGPKPKYLTNSANPKSPKTRWSSG